MTTVIISEKDEYTRIGLKAALQANEDIEVLDDYETDDMMLSDLSSLIPDVVILGGTEDILERRQTCQEVRTICPTAKGLTLSENQKADDLYEIILSGASGGVLKSAGSAEMVRSVRVIAWGGLSFENDALARLIGRIPRQDEYDLPFDSAELAERERTILTLVAQGHSNGEIGRMLNLSKFTIRNSIAQIRIKLGVKSRAELATFVVKHRLDRLP